jgi:hypothetical protein
MVVMIASCCAVMFLGELYCGASQSTTLLQTRRFALFSSVVND